MWEAPDACDECEPQVVASRSYCRNCGLTLDATLTGTSGMSGPLWSRSGGGAHPLPTR